MKAVAPGGAYVRCKIAKFARLQREEAHKNNQTRHNRVGMICHMESHCQPLFTFIFNKLVHVRERNRSWDRTKISGQGFGIYY